MKTINIGNIAIWRHQNKTNGIGMRILGKLTSVNNISGSVRCHKNLYEKLNAELEKCGL